MEKSEWDSKRLNVEFMHGDDKEGQRFVRVEFGRMINYLILPKEHAVHFALRMLEHAGADIRNLKDSETAIDITPDKD